MSTVKSVSDSGHSVSAYTMSTAISFIALHAKEPVLIFSLEMSKEQLVDRLLAMSGLYRFVWHPALFRASLLVCICGLLGLAVYR